MRFDRTIAIDAPVLTAVTLLRALLHLRHRGSSPVREVSHRCHTAWRAQLPQALAAAVLLSACGVGEGGMGLPAQLPGEAYPGFRQDVRGVLEVAPNGCFDLVIDGTPWFVIWPAGSQLDDRVRLRDGRVIAEGATVVGIGAFTETAPLVAKGGYWANALGFCAPGADEVLVLDSAAVLPAG